VGHPGARTALQGAEGRVTRRPRPRTPRWTARRAPDSPRPGGGHRRRSSGRATGRPRWVEASLPHKRDDDLLKAPAAPLVGREEVAVELAGGAVHDADNLADGDLKLSGVARPAESSGGRRFQGRQVEPVWLPTQRRREVMALVLSACPVEGVLGVQPRAASWAADRSFQAEQAPGEPEQGKHNHPNRDIQQQVLDHDYSWAREPSIHHVGGCGSTAGSRSAAVRWSSCLPCLVIGLLIQTIRRDRLDPTGSTRHPT
jgi:hypothetical protein